MNCNMFFLLKDEDKYEKLIVETKDKNKLEMAKKWAEKCGYETRLLIHHEGDKPDFIGTISNLKWERKDVEK